VYTRGGVEMTRSTRLCRSATRAANLLTAVVLDVDALEYMQARVAELARARAIGGIPPVR
jgi:hypothetical protein